MDSLKYLKRKILSAKSMQDKLNIAVDEIMDYLHHLFPDIDLEDVKCEDENTFVNCSNLKEAILCYITYNEGDIDEILNLLESLR